MFPNMSPLTARANRVPENVPGRFYVTTDCTHCATCLLLAPGHFAGGDPEWKTAAYVSRQPVTPDEIRQCLAALTGCPCAAIGDDDTPPHL